MYIPAMKMNILKMEEYMPLASDVERLNESHCDFKLSPVRPPRV